VKNRSLDQALLLLVLKRFSADQFRPEVLVPEDIADGAPLNCGAFDLDSLDMLELVFCVEEGIGISIRCEGAPHSAFGSIASLADFIRAQARAQEARQLTSAGFPAIATLSGIPAGIFARRAIA
jgi:acyl carrier protein